MAFAGMTRFPTRRPLPLVLACLHLVTRRQATVQLRRRGDFILLCPSILVPLETNPVGLLRWDSPAPAIAGRQVQ